MIWPHMAFHIFLFVFLAYIIMYDLWAIAKKVGWKYASFIIVMTILTPTAIIFSFQLYMHYMT